MLSPFIQKLDSRFRLSEADKASLERASARMYRLGVRNDLVREGDKPNEIYVIKSGFACRYKILPNGSRSIVAFLVPGDMCDPHGSILGEMDHCIGTLSACEVVTIPREIILDLRANHPTLNHALQWSMLVDEAILREWLVGMGRRPAVQHVAHLLCELLMRLQVVGCADANSYELPLTQADIGDTAGLSNVHVNRVLKELRGKELIVYEGKSLSIPDVGALKAFADFNPNYLHLNPKPYE
jgi:CRP-like cAMP-binding protein